MAISLDNFGDVIITDQHYGLCSQMSSSDEGEAGRRKRFLRHQVEALDAVFKACPHPDEKQRIDLSRRLGLKPQQIKFWFQNKRTHIKTQNDKHANTSLRSENDKIRCETVGIHLALRNCVCPKCGVQSLSEEEEQKVHLENDCIKAEIDRCIGIITKQLGRSFAEISVMQSPLDHLSTAARANRSYGPSLNIDVLSNNSSMNAPLLPINTPISDSDKALLIEQATNAMEELIVLVRTNDPLWIKSMYEDKDILDHHNYRKIFRKFDHHFADPDIRVEASRALGLVCMNPLALVDMFMDPAKWTDLFPTIVSKAKIIEVLSVGMGGNNYSGSSILMYSDIEIPSPLILSREYYFIRYCQQVENGFWFITDVSVDFPGYPVNNRKLPSGCLIQEMPNGYSMVTWVEHLVEEKSQYLGIFQNFVHSGMAFGAQRWLATLQRMTERFHYMLMHGQQNMDFGGVISTQESKQSMMTLSHGMVKSFCDSLCPANEIQQCTLWDANDIQIRVMPRNIVADVEPNGMILNAITSTWLPFSSEHVFGFFRNESNRDQWDILSVGSLMQPVSNIYSGLNVGNSVSILRVVTSDQRAELLVQETCTDSSVSMLVYASVDNPTMEIVLSGGDTSNITMNPSGVAILPNCNPSVSIGPSSSSNPTISGSFVTLSFQIVMNSQASSNLSTDSLASISRMISDNMQNVKTALNFS